MHSFDHLLNWKLKQGSHPFPGPDGGTCINEAALVAAGFAYQSISSVEQMPACFSRPICTLAMWLNDDASDRQHLLPFVTRLICADTPEVERQRMDYIDRHTRAYPYGIPFDLGLAVLEGALAIGRQADPFAPDEVQARMDAARKQPWTSTEAPAAPNPSLTSRVKSWLGSKVPQSAA